MVLIISISSVQQYLLFERDTYAQVLKAYLSLTISDQHEIILIYDTLAERIIYKINSFKEHYPDLKAHFLTEKIRRMLTAVK